MLFWSERFSAYFWVLLMQGKISIWNRICETKHEIHCFVCVKKVGIIIFSKTKRGQQTVDSYTEGSCLSKSIYWQTCSDWSKIDYMLLTKTLSVIFPPEWILNSFFNADLTMLDLCLPLQKMSTELKLSDECSSSITHPCELCYFNRWYECNSNGFIYGLRTAWHYFKL